MINTYTFKDAHTELVTINGLTYYFYKGFACVYGETWQAITEEETKLEPKAKFVYAFNPTLNDQYDSLWRVFDSATDFAVELAEEALGVLA
jgi:hypothetical protein